MRRALHLLLSISRKTKATTTVKGMAKKKWQSYFLLLLFCCCCFLFGLPSFFTCLLWHLLALTLSLYFFLSLSLANSSHCTRTRSICSHTYTHAHIETVRRTHTNVNTRAVGYTSLSAKQEQRIKQCGHTACVCNGINISCSSSCCC